MAEIRFLLGFLMFYVGTNTVVDNVTHHWTYYPAQIGAGLAGLGVAYMMRSVRRR